MENNLAVLIRSHRDNHYDRLDFQKSGLNLGHYVFSQPPVPLT